MGFGSYDESEQGSQDTNIDEDATVTRENDHEGEVNFDSGADSDELIDRLESMKGDED